MNQTTTGKARKPFSIIALLGLLISLTGVVLFAISVFSYRSGDWFWLDALKYAEWGVYATGVGFLVSLAGFIVSRPGAKRRGFIISLLGLALAAPLLGMAARFEYAARIYPPINDITTDTEDPPVFWDMPNTIEYPGEAVAAQQKTAYPGVKPLEVKMAPDAAYALALEMVKERGWDIIAEADDEGRIEAVASSALYGFKDEVVIRIQEADVGSRIDIRSRSRIGRIDRGVNAKRIEAFLADLRGRTPGQNF